MAPLGTCQLILAPALALLACVGAPSDPIASYPERQFTQDVQQLPPAPPPSVERSSAGRVVGSVLSVLTPPALEHGTRGLLQAVPTVRTLSTKTLTRTWTGIKRDADLRSQHKRLSRMGLDRTVSDELVDLRALEGAGLPPFGSRDRVRGRTWVTRTMAAVLVVAWRRFHAQHPDARLTLGDLAQPGGGSIAHNAIVRNEAGKRAQALLNRGAVYGGAIIADEHLQASSFPGELGRFDGPADAVWLHHHLAGNHQTATDSTALRVITTRYTFPTTLPDKERNRAFGEMKAIVLRGVLVATERVRHTAHDGTLTYAWRQHWVDPKSKRQLIALSRKKQRRRLRAKWAEDLRVAKWQQRKPGSFPKERRWRLSAPGSDGQRTWTRWQAMREAGHVSHMGGSDADISFVTRGNSRHFAVDLSVLDSKRTWDWFKAIDAASREMHTKVDVILISSSVIRTMERRLPKSLKRNRLWRSAIRRAPGHDAHHHLRLAQPTRDSDARARTILAALGPAAAASAPPGELAAP